MFDGMLIVLSIKVVACVHVVLCAGDKEPTKQTTNRKLRGEERKKLRTAAIDNVAGICR